MADKAGKEKITGKTPETKATPMRRADLPEKTKNIEKTEMFSRLFRSGVDIGFVFHDE